MPLSESRKRANKKWSQNNTKLLTVRFNNKDIELIENYCKQNNISKSKLIRDRLSDILGK